MHKRRLILSRITLNLGLVIQRLSHDDKLIGYSVYVIFLNPNPRIIAVGAFGPKSKLTMPFKGPAKNIYKLVRSQVFHERVMGLIKIVTDSAGVEYTSFEYSTQLLKLWSTST